MPFGYTILYVADVSQTVAFYAAVFGLTSKFVMPDGSYAEMDTGSTTLSFCARALAEKNVGLDFVLHGPKPMPMEIGFVVEDVALAYAQAIAKGACPVLAPVSKPWGQMVSYVKDNNGFLVELCSAVA